MNQLRSKTVRFGIVLLCFLQQAVSFSGVLHAAEISPAAQPAVPTLKLDSEAESELSGSVASKIFQNEDNENPLSQAGKAEIKKIADEISKPLPKSAVKTASNPDFYYAERTQNGSVTKVYDLYNKSGIRLMTITKDTANIRGNYSAAIGAPDVSPDGKYLILGKFQQSSYTGHVIQSLIVDIYDIANKKLVPPSLTLLEKDNSSIGSVDQLMQVRFVPGTPHTIKVSNSYYGQEDYYNAASHKRTLPPQAVAMASNPNFYYAERTQPGSVPKVYDIYDREGNRLFSIPKETAQIQGNYSYAVGVPDVSPDGKYMVIGNFQNSRYTGHVIQTLSVQIYNMQTKQLSGPALKLVEKDNVAIAPHEFPGAIQFIPGSSSIIRINRGLGVYQYYDILARTWVLNPGNPPYKTNAVPVTKK